jgi:hypothetical protein
LSGDLSLTELLIAEANVVPFSTRTAGALSISDRGFGNSRSRCDQE